MFKICLFASKRTHSIYFKKSEHKAFILNKRHTQLINWIAGITLSLELFISLKFTNINVIDTTWSRTDCLKVRPTIRDQVWNSSNSTLCSVFLYFTHKKHPETRLWVYFWMVFKNHTIWKPDLLPLFENRTSEVFRSPLYHLKRWLWSPFKLIN